MKFSTESSCRQQQKQSFLEVHFSKLKMCLCSGGGAEQGLMIAAFIRNLARDNENKVFSALDHLNDMRLSETDHHIGQFHFTEHVLICGNRDEQQRLRVTSAKPPSISHSLMTKTDHMNLLDSMNTQS